MSSNAEKNSRRVLAAGVLFAGVGILSLIITLMQPALRDDRARNPDEIFHEYTIEEKAAILDSVSASTHTDSNASGASPGASSSSQEPTDSSQISDEEKLRVLESLSQ